jgi:hypothetical protein
MVMNGYIFNAVRFILLLLAVKHLSMSIRVLCSRKEIARNKIWRWHALFSKVFLPAIFADIQQCKTREMHGVVLVGSVWNLNFFFLLKFNMVCTFWIVLMCWCQKWFLKNKKTSLACILARKVIWKAFTITLPNMLYVGCIGFSFFASVQFSFFLFSYQKYCTLLYKKTYDWFA